jgi:SAM-dependent methyltransferase
VRFDDLKTVWEGYGEADPLWAILTWDDRKDRKWDPAEFFATGERNVDSLWSEFERRGLAPANGSALDFGCGVGRLTRPLGARFQRVVGVDIAASMIEQAKELNAAFPNVEFLVNAKPDLSLFGDSEFDYVQTFLVLQHMHPELQCRYLTEFARILKPGGVLVVQMPERDFRSDLAAVANGIMAMEDVISPSEMAMYAVPAPMVLSILDGVCVDIMFIASSSTGDPNFKQSTYYGIRQAREKHHPFMAVSGFEEVMDSVVARTCEYLIQAGGNAPAQESAHDRGTVQRIAALERDLAHLRHHHQAVLSSRTWRIGSRVAKLAAGFKGKKS